MLDLIEAESGPNPTATLLILHGLGADGNDFVPIAQQLELQAVGTITAISSAGSPRCSLHRRNRVEHASASSLT